MKKYILVLFLIAAMLLCAGCKEKEVKVPALSDPNETMITEMILWENVLTERWL